MTRNKILKHPTTASRRPQKAIICTWIYWRNRSWFFHNRSVCTADPAVIPPENRKASLIPETGLLFTQQSSWIMQVSEPINSHDSRTLIRQKQLDIFRSKLNSFHPETVLFPLG